MAASETTICSNAVLMLGGNPINDLTENTDGALLASNLYPQVRDDLLRAHPWNCCVKRVALAPMVETPPFDYSYQFLLPGDFLRVLSCGQRNDEHDYQIEDGKILANVTVLYLRYIRRNEVVASWGSTLIQAMTLAMAARMAYGITKSTSVESQRVQELEMVLRRARAVDGQENPPEEMGGYPLLNSRFAREP